MRESIAMANQIKVLNLWPATTISEWSIQLGATVR
jgi:hypothetical protein